MKKETEVWLEIAKEDYENMEVMLKAHRLRGAVFFAQQSVEKILKGYIVEYTDQTPRKTHFIEKLIEDAGLDLTEIGNPEVELLSTAYGWVRYSDLSRSHFKEEKDAEPLIKMTQSIYLWVKNKFKTH